MASVYALGYQSGIMQAVQQTPHKLEQQILQSILLSVGVSVKDHPNKVVIFSDTDDLVWENPPGANIANGVQPYAPVAVVGYRIVQAAQQHCREQLQTAMQHVDAQLPPDMTPSQAMQYYAANETVVFWQQALERVQGDSSSSSSSSASNPWHYVLIDSPQANAFVTEILPRRFFITTSMLQVATTANELAIVLGHEGNV